MKEPIVEKTVSPACSIKELKELCGMSDKRFKFECNSLRNTDQLRDVGVKDGDTISSRHRRCDADIAASSSNGARIRGAAPSVKHLRWTLTAGGVMPGG